MTPQSQQQQQHPPTSSTDADIILEDHTATMVTAPTTKKATTTTTTAVTAAVVTGSSRKTTTKKATRNNDDDVLIFTVPLSSIATNALPAHNDLLLSTSIPNVHDSTSTSVPAASTAAASLPIASLPTASLPTAGPSGSTTYIRPPPPTVLPPTNYPQQRAKSTTTTTTTNANITATGQATTSTPKKKRYSNETKIQVLLALETRHHTSMNEIAKEYDIPARTITDWRKGADKIRNKIPVVAYKIAVASAEEKIRDDKKIQDNKIAEEDNRTAKILRDLDERIAVASAEEKIRDDKKAETKRKRAERNEKKKAETKRKRAERNEKKESTYLFDHQKPTKTPTTEVLHDVEYNKRFVRPYICGGFVYSPSKGVSTDNLVVALIKEIMLLLDQKLLTKNDVSALFHKKTIQDGSYIQLNLKGEGADKILQNFKNIAPIICFLIKKWKNNPDTSKGDKMLIYPPGASTDTHIDEEKTHRINLHFGEEKTLMLVKDKQLSTIYDELICKPNCEYQIYGGNRDMFCNSTICFHKGMIKGKSAGFTIVTNPQSNVIALGRPAFLSDVFLELNSLVLVEDLKCSSQSVEYYSHLLKEKFSTYREKL